MTTMRYDNGPTREWLRRMADAEDRCDPALAGGLAEQLGMLRASSPEPPRILGRLVEFARRSHGLTVEELAEKADVDLGELVAIELDGGVTPKPRTVFQLAQALRLAPGKLMELSGLAQPRDEGLSEAALRFAARSEPSAKLSEAERQAFEEFVKVLVEASDGA